MNLKEYGLVTFHSTHHALKAEKVFKKLEIEAMMIPIPKEITANCGTGIKFNLIDLEKINNLFKKRRLRFWGFYKIERYNGEKKIEKLNL